MGAVALWHVTYDNLVIFFQVQLKLILVIHNPSDPLEGLTNKLVHDFLSNDFAFISRGGAISCQCQN